jgi:2-polyprenyl-3-methyl-5-hydroxy-6-metoxy-1,4-benzoquinol methylase
MRLAVLKGHESVGIEINSEAVEAARRDGLDMRQMTLEAFRASGPQRFDRVVSFQVLEHVSDPIGMIEDMWALTEDTGRLCYAVPNSRSFIRFANSIMDLPPHHVSRWTPSAARKIGALIGARKTVVIEAPVEPIHYGWCAGIICRKLPGGRLTNNRISRSLAVTALKYGLNYAMRGHTLYVEYHK